MFPLAVIPGVFTRDECAQFIERLKEHTIPIHDANYSVYDCYEFKDGRLSAFVKSKMRCKCLLSNKWRYVHYASGGFITSHLDGHVSIGPETKSNVSILVYLNDQTEYQGGELELLDGNGVITQVRPGVGSMVILDQQLLHQVNAIKSGDRHILRGDGWLG